MTLWMKGGLVDVLPSQGFKSNLAWISEAVFSCGLGDNNFERQAMVVKHLLCAVDSHMQGLGHKILGMSLQEGLMQSWVYL